MGAEEEMVITLSGGAPWGFRLQGGSEQKKPLQVSKIRKRSKACRGGLWENDVLVSINGKSCAGLSHATAISALSPPSSHGRVFFQLPTPHSLLFILLQDSWWGPDGPTAAALPFPRAASALPAIPAQPPGTAAELRAGRSPGHHAAPAAPEGTAAPGQPHLPARQRGEAPPGPQEEPTLPARQHQQQGGRAPGRGVPVRAERLREHAGGRHAGGTCLSLSLAELHRHESIQEKNVKEAKTKCRTIASLLTDAPNPHSKGVLMFKKRRQRAKKYTLISFGSVDEDRSYEEEDGVFPTSESEFDEEGFSDARSLTNNSDWDNTYLDIEKSKSDSEQKDEKQKGLSEASGKGARLFEQQRERAGKYTVEKVPAEKGPQLAPAVQPQPGMLNGEMPVPQKTTAQPRAPGTASSSLYISPAPPQHVVSSSPLPAQPSPATSPATPRPPSEPLTSREQRISVPAPRTGILQEARRRGNKKPMFSKIEEKKKNSPNPELLSLVQNLDEKPKGDHPGAGFESGPEEDFLSLGAEACNFMQSSGRKFKTPPPVAPKPQQQDAGLVNGAHDMPQLKGKGAELFAKRQSRMDKFVVETTPKPESKPRTPSPSPSLPSSWKYSPNIRAPPPIAYNPMHSPFYPLAASKSQASKAESKVKKAPGQKSGLKVIDFMRHQPYQLKSAMFCFGDPPSPSTQEPPAQAAPQPGSTEMASSAPATPAPFQVELSQSPKPYQSSPELVQASLGPSPNPASASRFQVARPKFSAARTGMQANVWRPSFGHH
uniref:Synaptopodin 2-like protein n=1 Tax=Anas platyrhynchos TaxID=8839 RepID=A0A8B9SL92_ANAPL